MSVRTASYKGSSFQDEHILVVKQNILFPQKAHQGIRSDNTDWYLNAITTHGEFHPRSLMEENPRYKQIIPYIIAQHQNSLFLMQRKKTASEKRLPGKYSLGIGGHIKAQDLGDTKDIFTWARREFEEEVAYEGTINIAPLGLINDDSNDVGRVHIGLVLLLTTDTTNISVKSELAHGALTHIDQCLDYVPYMEPWSQIALMHLVKGYIKNKSLT